MKIGFASDHRGYELKSKLIELLKAEKDKSAQLEAKNKTLVKQNYDLALNNAAYTETAPEKPKIERTIQEISKDLAEANFGRKDRMRCTELSLELDDAYLREFGKSSYLPHAVHNNDVIFRDDITVEAKNDALHNIIEKIVFEKAKGNLAIYFHDL